ncbi:MAG TPA: hypothetical protein VHO91_06155, partial [Rhodopila sp.]|nr:hypothetical protein [Rhodopila sp.]
MMFAVAAAAFEYALINGVLAFFEHAPGPATMTVVGLGTLSTLLAIPFATMTLRATLGMKATNGFWRAQMRLLLAGLRLAGRALLLSLLALCATSLEFMFVVGVSVPPMDGPNGSREAVLAFNLILPTFALWPATWLFLSRYMLVLPAAVAGTQLRLREAAALLRGNTLRMA